MLRTVGDQPTLWEAICRRSCVGCPRSWLGWMCCWTIRCSSPRSHRFRSADRSAVDAGGDLSAVDVFEVPLPAGVRVVVSGGVGFDHLATVLPGRHRSADAASDDADEADHPLRLGRGRRAERGAAGQCGRGETAALHPVRVDTTVVPSNVAYPTDAGLLAKAVGRIAATGRRIRAAGGATRTRLRDRSRAAGKRAHAIASKLRSRAAAGRDEAMAAVKKANAELADLADTAAEEAGRLLANAKRALRKARTTAAQRKLDRRPDPVAGRRRGRLVRAVNDLEELLEATRRIAAQTRQRL